MHTTLIANLLVAIILIIRGKSNNYSVPHAILFPYSQTPSFMSFPCGLTPNTGVCIDCSGQDVEIIMTSHRTSHRSSAFLFYIQEIIQGSHPCSETTNPG
jgi:hypothetical protein